MEYDFMKARQGDVFETKIQVQRNYCVSKRYVVIDYTGNDVIAVCLGKPKLWRGKVRTKSFSYDEFNKNNFELLNIR